MSTPILATKLYIPRLRPNVVSRPHLLERLNEGLHRKLTLISALAGFGKTTLVSQWLASGPRPAAWLSLDEGENDPARFLTYLVAALQTIAAKIGAGVLGALQSPQLPPAKAIATAAHDVERATCLIEGDGMPLQFRGAVTAVLHWLESLPKTVLDARPALWVMYASALSMTGFLPGIEPKLQAAEAALQGAEPDDTTRNLVGHIAVIRASLAAAENQVEAVVLEAHGDKDQALHLLLDALAVAEPGGFIRTFVDEGLPMAHLLSDHRNERQESHAFTTLDIRDVQFYVSGMPGRGVSLKGQCSRVVSQACMSKGRQLLTRMRTSKLPGNGSWCVLRSVSRAAMRWRKAGRLSTRRERHPR